MLCTEKKFNLIWHNKLQCLMQAGGSRSLVLITVGVSWALQDLRYVAHNLRASFYCIRRHAPDHLSTGERQPRTTTKRNNYWDEESRNRSRTVIMYNALRSRASGRLVFLTTVRTNRSVWTVVKKRQPLATVRTAPPNGPFSHSMPKIKVMLGQAVDPEEKQ